MSVVLSIACGHDASYPCKTAGAAESPVITGQCEAGYYLSVVENGGEPAGTRRFGLERACRPASEGQVIAGFSKKAVAQFSSRLAQITETTLALAEQYEKDRRQALDQRPLAGRGRFANAMTRRAKGPSALDFTALLRCWERASRVPELETLRDLTRTVWRSAPDATARTGTRRDTRVELARMSARLASRGELTHAQERRSWTPVSRGRKSHEHCRCAAWHRLWQLQAQLHACAAGG